MCCNRLLNGVPRVPFRLLQLCCLYSGSLVSKSDFNQLHPLQSISLFLLILVVDVVTSNKHDFLIVAMCLMCKAWSVFLLVPLVVPDFHNFGLMLFTSF